MSDIHDSLAAWRQAERLRDTIPRQGDGRADAEEEVRHACLVYQAILARATARYQVPSAPTPSAWWPSFATMRTGPAR